METFEFNALFDSEDSERVVAVGGYQDGRSLFWESNTLTVALLRTELRYSPPPELTLLVLHRRMRNMDEEIPTSPPKRPNDYPLKLRPNEAKSLLAPGFRYRPQNLGRFDRETFDYSTGPTPRLRMRLEVIGRELCSILPELDRHWTSERFVRHLTSEGENAWCEQMWINDLQPDME